MTVRITYMAAWTTAGLLLAAAPFVAQSDGVRRVMSDGRPIPDQLRPGDKHVTLEINADRPMLVTPRSGQSMLEMMTQNTSWAVVAVIESKEAALTLNQNWIRTDAIARIDRILKSSPEVTLQVGDPIVLEERGGTIVLGETRVDAVVPWARPLHVGSRYLVFATLLDSGEVAIDAASMYEELPGGALRRVMSVQPGEANDIEDMSLVQVAQRMSRLE